MINVSEVIQETKQNTISIQKEKVKTSNKVIFDTIWSDSLGKNFFKISKFENDDYQSELNIKLVASLSNDKGQIILKDSISDCPVEYHMDFIKNSVKLIDKNDNGKKELLFAYSYTCRGDMIGDTLKIVAIENNKIWNVKGLRTNSMDEQIAEFEKRKISDYGSIKYNTTPNFLKENAVKLWLKYSKEEEIKSDKEVDVYYKSMDE